MSPVSLCLNLLLATLLSATLMLGWRLNRRLKALKDSHAGFAAAVADLDRAAMRAEKGLADLRAATDEAVEFLAGRIEKGRELAAKLERLTAVAAASSERAAPAAASRPAPSPPRAPPAFAPPAFESPSFESPTFDRAPFAPAPAAAERLWSRAPREKGAASAADVEAAAESLALRLSEVLDGPPPQAAPLRAAVPPRPSPRSRPAIDDDLFEAPETPAPRAFTGGR